MIVNELKNIESQEERLNLLTEYINNDGKLTGNFLDLVHSQNDRELLVRQYSLKGGKISGYILQRIDSQKFRDEIVTDMATKGIADKYVLDLISDENIKYELTKQNILNCKKLDANILDKIPSQEEKESLTREYLQKGGIIDSNVLQRFEDQEIKNRFVRQNIENGGELNNNIFNQIKNTRFKDGIIRLALDNGVNVNYKIMENDIYTTASSTENMRVLKQYLENGGYLTRNILCKLLTTESQRYTIVKEYLDSGKNNIETEALGLADYKYNKDLIVKYLENGGYLTRNILDLIINDAEREEIILLGAKNGGRNLYIKYLDPNKRFEVLNEYFANGGNVTTDIIGGLEKQRDRIQIFKQVVEKGEYLYGVLDLINSYDARKEIANMYIEKTGQVNEEVIRYLETQEQRINAINNYIENGGQIDKEIMVYIDDQNAREEILFNYIRKNKEVDCLLIETINSISIREELLKEYSKLYKVVPSKLFLTPDVSQEVIVDISRTHIENKGSASIRMLLGIDSQEIREELLDTHIENGHNLDNSLIDYIVSEEVIERLLYKYIEKGGKTDGEIFTSVSVDKQKNLVKAYVNKGNKINSYMLNVLTDKKDLMEVVSKHLENGGLVNATILRKFDDEEFKVECLRKHVINGGEIYAEISDLIEIENLNKLENEGFVSLKVLAEYANIAHKDDSQEFKKNLLIEEMKIGYLKTLGSCGIIDSQEDRMEILRAYINMSEVPNIDGLKNYIDKQEDIEEIVDLFFEKGECVDNIYYFGEILRLSDSIEKKAQWAISNVKSGGELSEDILNIFESQEIKEELIEEYLKQSCKTPYRFLYMVGTREKRVDILLKRLDNKLSIRSDDLDSIDSFEDRTRIIERALENNLPITRKTFTKVDRTNRVELYKKNIQRILNSDNNLETEEVKDLFKEEEIKDVLNFYIENGGKINGKIINLLENDEDKKNLYIKYVQKGGNIDFEDYDFEMLYRLKNESIEEIVKLALENDRFVTTKIAEYIQNNKLAVEVIKKGIQKGDNITSKDYFLFKDDINEDELEEMLINILENERGIPTFRMIEDIQSQEKIKNVLNKMAEIGATIDSSLIELLESNQDRLDIVIKQLEAGTGVQYFSIKLFDSQEIIKEIIIRNIKNNTNNLGEKSLYLLENKGRIEVANIFFDELKENIKDKNYPQTRLKVDINNIFNIINSIDNSNDNKDTNKKQKIQVINQAINKGIINESLLIQISDLIEKPDDLKGIIENYCDKMLKQKEEFMLVHNNMFSSLDKINEMIEKAQNETRKMQLQNQKDMITTIINDIDLGLIVLDSSGSSKFEEVEGYKKVMAWKEKGRIPDKLIFDKIPSDKVEQFDFKIWNNLIKSVNKDLKDEEKGALVEIAYVFGLFDKELKTSRGIAKTDEEMTDEEKMQNSAWENYEARKSNVIQFINSLESTDALHEMFDGMGMEFNPKFYHFFQLNKEDIRNNVKLVEDEEILEGIHLGNIQSELKTIYEEIGDIEYYYRTGTPTINQCTNYIINLRKKLSHKLYENIEEGNSELAKLCALCGCTQAYFEEYQKLFDKSKSRDYSSIPRIKASKKVEVIEEDENKKVTVEKNKIGNDQLKIEKDGKQVCFEILRMDDPRATVCGEKIFSNCCQSLYGAGSSCMKHSQDSKNGGILAITSETGTFLGQSWCWVNGNVLCFDSAELKGLEENRNMTYVQKEEYLEMIKIGYEQMAKRMLEESAKKVEEYEKEQKAKAKVEFGEDNAQYKEKEQQIESKCESIKIKQVTIGEGYWSVSKKLSEMYEKDQKRIYGKRTEKNLPSPIEKVDYIQDSDIQYELARAQGVKNEDIQYSMSTDNQEHLFNDKRRIIKTQSNIDRDTFAKMKEIEKKAHKKDMQLMRNIETPYEINIGAKLSQIYDVDESNIKVICGEDWYYVYSENEENIVIHDAARAPEARLKGEENISQAEVVEAFYEIMEESASVGKPIKAQLREDTSYALYLKMLEKGQLEQIGDENVYNFKTGDKVEYTDEEKEQLHTSLKSTQQRQEMAKNSDTVMHEIECNVTEKGKAMIKRMKDRYERE